ncbi:MBL fold metallo-hydrolase [Leucobacter ruminantium]|uniref:MBL fold metallo-hydrolase n=1 Tax=Leucobacter ruminantium TaxID=1289170 RepID=A0A939S0L6_9MICO|nr:MBL fold metallo-hydrolase [Leucobacter ruminantium]MBO1806649.1 MBL fold metallo-hydrolase [Leucobacter ruminantium]
MRITRYGQSAMLVEEGGARILIDPGSLSGEAVFGLTGLDAILITHEHADHVDAARVPALLEANPAIPLYAPASVLEALGLDDEERGRVVANGDRFDVGGVSIEAVGELHELILPSMPRCANVGFVLAAADGRRVFHPGDSYETVPSDIGSSELRV